MNEYQPKTLIEYLANELVNGGGEVDTKGIAEVIAEGIYETLQLAEVDLSIDKEAMDDFRNVQDHIQDMLDNMLPDAEAVARDWGEE